MEHARERLIAGVDDALAGEEGPSDEVLARAAAHLGCAPTRTAVAAAGFEAAHGERVVAPEGLFCLAEALVDTGGDLAACDVTKVRDHMRQRFTNPFPPPLPGTPVRLDSVDAVEAMEDHRSSYPWLALRALAGERSELCVALARLERCDPDDTDELVRLADDVEHLLCVRVTEALAAALAPGPPRT